MRPILIELGPLVLPSYFTLLMVGYMVAVWLATRDAESRGVKRDDLLDLSLVTLIAGLIGARLLHVLADGYFWDYVHLCTDPLQVEVPSFIHVICEADADCVTAEAGALCNPETRRCHPARDCFAALKFWQGGLAFYGGLLLAMIAGHRFMKRRQMSFRTLSDLAAAGIALGLVFGRLGCFLAGCCFGQPVSADYTEGGVGVRFPGYVTAVGAEDTCPPGYDLIRPAEGPPRCAFGRPAFMEHAEHHHLPDRSKQSLPVHATQLYEAAFCLALFLWLQLYRRTRLRWRGQAFAELVLVYGFGRFLVEFARADARGLWLADSLSTSQLIALPMVGWAAWILWKNRGSAGGSPPAPPASPTPQPPGTA